MLTSQLRPLVPSGTGTDSDTSPSVCVQAYVSWSCPLPTFGSAIQQRKQLDDGNHVLACKDGTA